MPADEPVVAKETEGHGVELVAPSAHAEDEDDAVSRRRSSVRPHSSGESMGFEGGEFADAPTALDKHHKFPLLQLVLQDQDIDSAVNRVKSILAEMEPRPVEELAEEGKAPVSEAATGESDAASE